MAKRLNKLTPIVNTGESIFYCRRCAKLKKETDFYKTFDTFLDTNNRLSICSECIAEIYALIYNTEHSMERTIYRLCRLLNIKYDLSAVQATITQLENQGKPPDDNTCFGIYKSKLIRRGAGISGEANLEGDFTFQEDTTSPSRDSAQSGDFDSFETVSEFWGSTKYSVDDYRFLERELSEWKRSYSCQNKAEEFFMKQICLKALELEKARVEEKSVDAILKSMQDLLKNAALTPAQQTAASSGKGTETWGLFIKTIEETTPAEFYKDKTLFADFDNIGAYIQKYIVRPLKNFVTGSRDFNIVDSEMEALDEYLEEGGENVGEVEQTP